MNNDWRGLFKGVINKDRKEILGGWLYGKEWEEVIRLMKVGIDEDIG